jgi:heme/copper-type cytochrome/quinol oxidase subunit 4
MRNTVRHSVIGEGLIAGSLGAATVAVWFLVVDVLRGTPFLVPDALGHVLLHMGGGGVAESRITHVATYTVVHFLAFAVVGVLAAAVLRRSERQPSVLAGALLLFAVFEAGFFMFTLLMAQSNKLGMPAWYLVATGNLIAAVVMGTYLWRVHPNLRGRGESVLSGRHGL